MTKPLRILTTALLALVLAAPASGGGPDNAAVAVNTKDGSSIFRLAFSIKKVAGDVVDQTNSAVAYSSCESCRTVAIAIQIVLVVGSPSVVTPTNMALAINDQCTLCETLASAYQFVLGKPEPVKFTSDGRRRIAEIRQQLRALGKSGLDVVQVQTRIGELVDQLRGVLANDLVPKGAGEEEEPDDSSSEEETGEVTTAPTGPVQTSTTGGTTTLPPPTTTTSPTTTAPTPTSTTTEPTTTTAETTTTPPTTTTTTTTTVTTTETTPPATTGSTTTTTP